MKRNSKKINNHFTKVEKNKKTKEKKIFHFNYTLLKNNQIPIAGKHSILSALKNKNRKLHYLITTNTNFLKWKTEIDKLKLKLDIAVKTK